MIPVPTCNFVVLASIQVAGVGAIGFASPGLRKAQSLGFFDTFDVEFGVGAGHVDGNAKSHGILLIVGPQRAGK
jgi:hypothetical protein